MLLGHPATQSQFLKVEFEKRYAVRETPNKLLMTRKWTAWERRKARFSDADYWITKATPWLSALTGAPLPHQTIIGGVPSTDSTGQTAWSIAPCSWPSHGSGSSHNRIKKTLNLLESAREKNIFSTTDAGSCSKACKFLLASTDQSAS